MVSKVLKLYLLSMLLGILVGIIGTWFQLGIRNIDEQMQLFFHFIAMHGLPVGLISALLTMLMVLLSWLTVQYIAPEASGSGVPEIEGALFHLRPIYWKRLIPVKFFGGLLALSGKMVMGREGPTIHIGGNLGAMIAEWFALSKLRRDVLVAAGAAAGLAVAFNAPLAGVLFIMEEMREQFNYSFLNFKMVLICSISATITLNYLIGTGPAIQMDVFNFPGLNTLYLFFIYGIVVGLVGLLFNKALIALLMRVDKIGKKQKLYYVLMVGFVVGYLAYLYPPMVGGGERIIHQALSFTPAFNILCALIVVRFFTSIICYSTGIPGGIFAPLLSLGTLLGLAVFYVLQWLHIDIAIEPGMFAVAGMGALFAAVVRAPITGVVLIVEMTQNYSLILPLMVSCLTSTTLMQLARDKPIYTQLLARTLYLKSKTEPA